MTNVNPLAEEWEKRGLLLQDHQKEGVEQMYAWYQAGHGGINGDEMGLGKTCQAIVLMVKLMKDDSKGPFLVVSPLSVCDHWLSEVQKFSCGELDPVSYLGYGEKRFDVLKKLGKLKNNTVFIVPYHIFRSDSEVIDNLQVKSGLKFDVVVVDEAHAIKNQDCQLAESLKPYKSQAWFLLMTGTPIQNNLHELYSLLTFIDSSKFRDSTVDRNQFASKYKETVNIDCLKKILSKYLIRRTKDSVCKDLPSCDQVIIYHNLSDLQKKLYLDIISRDYDNLLETTNGKQQSLINIHMQLRKCVAHPYLFKGVEPEPFVEGEHIVEASGKFQVLDRLLLYLRCKNHRCLIFTQFRILLDILQDFMTLRGYNYELIDGSVRAEERYASIKNFQAYAGAKELVDTDNEPWCFLLTTKSGGVGLNLTGADTVIFLDADWNPQNDIQAMARCHRIGQNRAVRVIRLIGRYTVEQHMNARIRDKLRFTDMVMGNEEMKLSAFDMLAMIKQSLATLKEQTNMKHYLTDEELESVIGKTDENGEWSPVINNKENQIPAELRLDPDEVDRMDTDCNDYRVFEGHSYRVNAKDEAAFDELRLLHLPETGRSAKRRCLKRVNDKDDYIATKEAAAKLKEIQRSRRLDAEMRKLQVQEKKAALWAANGYVSCKLAAPVSDEATDNEMIEEGVVLWYVHGDVTKPQRKEEDKTTMSLILHCVDDSGRFGSRGLFSCLRDKDPSIAERYELIARMQDLKLGSAHLISNVKDLRVPVEPPSTSSNIKESVVLLVAQSSRNRGIIRPSNLEQCLSRVGNYARFNDASVHMPRIGHGSSLAWYTVERLVKKHIANYGVPTYVYHAKFNYRRTPPPHTKITTGNLTSGSPLNAKDEVVTGIPEDITEFDGATSSDDSSNISDRSWSEEDEDETSEPYSTSDEGSRDELEELDDEPLIRKRRQGTRLQSSAEDRTSVGEQGLYDGCSFVLEEDSYGYSTPKRLTIFADVAVSLYGLQGDVDGLIAVFIANGGYVVTNHSELNDATHAVVPPEIVGDRDQFLRFRALFSADCVFVKADWISDSVAAGELLDPVAYESFNN